MSLRKLVCLIARLFVCSLLLPPLFVQQQYKRERETEREREVERKREREREVERKREGEREREQDERLAHFLVAFHFGTPLSLFGALFFPPLHADPLSSHHNNMNRSIATQPLCTMKHTTVVTENSNRGQQPGCRRPGADESGMRAPRCRPTC